MCTGHRSSKRMLVIWFALVAAPGGCSGPPLADPPGSSLTASYRTRDRHSIADLIAAMTLDEKIGLLIGNPIAGPPDPLGVAGAGYIPGVARLGIPPLRFTDGPAGVRTALPTTALPAPVVLAATFSRGLAGDYGAVLGAEAQGRQQDVLFGPMVNLVRVPTAGRNFETLGEDPLLQSELVAREIASIQRTGTMVTIKHFAENNQENNRMGVNVHVDDRTLNELELPPFEAAITAGAGSVMCAYNKVNGLFSCENPALLTDILRSRWGFDGFVVSDYGANHSTNAALEAGMDIEFLSTFFSGLGIRGGDPTTAIRFQVDHGLLDIAVVDGAVRHLLSAMAVFGLLDGASPAGAPVVDRPRPAIDPAASAAAAQRIAEAGAVLLKNAGEVLPLDRHFDRARALAVIGPTAKAPLLGGGGSALVLPFPGTRGPLEVLGERIGPAHIAYQTGIDLDGEPVPGSALSTAVGQPGLVRTTAPSGATQIDPQVDFTGAAALPAASAGGTATWTGVLTAPATGDYELKLQAIAATVGGLGGFATRLVLDGVAIASTGGIFPVAGSLISTGDGLANAGPVVHLDAGVPHAITVIANLSPAQATQVRLAWITPERRAAAVAAAVAAARAAQVAVVFAYNEGTEGTDRGSLALPRGQDALIAAIAAANPRTVVVLNTGDPVTMPWRDQVAGILEMWYPGQRGGEATTALLLGDVSPSGKLPVTFPVRIEDNPTFSADGSRYPGLANEEFYAEGIFVGYPWYDKNAIQPLFPFGHGLSYSRFRYSELDVRRARGGFDVSFVVQNVGRRRAAEAPQVYVGAPRNAPVALAARKLAGFARVDLAPGQAERVTVHVSRRALSFWSVEANDWAVAPGARQVFVGASSRDLRLSGVARGE